MSKLFSFVTLILAASAVSVADVFLKKAAPPGVGFAAALKSPWTIGAIGLYLFQIGFFLFAFVGGWKLTIVSILQIGLYALITLAAGILMFRETPSTIQIVAMVLTLIGVVLLNV